MKFSIKKSSIIVLIVCILIFSFPFYIIRFFKAAENSAAALKNNIQIQSFKVTDNKTIYANDNDNLEDLYITILNDNTNSMADANTWRFSRDNIDAARPTLNVRFDYNKPSGDLTGIKANAKLEPRGHGTSFAAQKSYKITLSSDAALWHDQTILNLNKQPYDLTRIRNKLSFDLMQLFDNLFSFRTQFCHVYIRDLSSGNKGYVDYGLFTDIEQPNIQYLKNHGIADKAYFYKAENFEFFMYEDVIKNVTDPGYNKSAFDNILKIKGIEDHTRLISMLKDVNDMTLNINDVIAKDFDRDNYLTWLATNILFGNHDTNSQNFLLVSPLNANKWYFIPWDFDQGMGYDTQIGVMRDYSSWEMEGISNYWGVVLHQRFFKDPKNVKDLTAKIEELSQIANKTTVEELISKYYEVTNQLIKSDPDIRYLLAPRADYENEIKRLYSTLEESKRKYYEGLQKPMPVFLGDPHIEGNNYIFKWDESYSLQGNDMYYDFTISTTPDFKDKVVQKLNIKENSTTINMLPKGTYYWKIEIYDSAGHKQIAFDTIEDHVKGVKYFGTKEFTVY